MPCAGFCISSLADVKLARDNFSNNIERLATTLAGCCSAFSCVSRDIVAIGYPAPKLFGTYFQTTPQRRAARLNDLSQYGSCSKVVSMPSPIPGDFVHEPLLGCFCFLIFTFGTPFSGVFCESNGPGVCCSS